MSSNGRIAAFVMLGIAFAVAAALQYQLSWLGFPDGFRSELERAERVLYIVFGGLSVAASLWFGWLGVRNAAGAPLYRSIFGYVLLLAVLIALDVYLQHRLATAGIG
jgi:hypothetical protein